MVITVIPGTAALGSNSGRAAYLIGPMLICALTHVVPVPMLVSPYITGMHGVGGGQSTGDFAGWNP